MKELDLFKVTLLRRRDSFETIVYIAAHSMIDAVRDAPSTRINTEVVNVVKIGRVYV